MTLCQGLANLFLKASQYFKLCGTYSFCCDYSVVTQRDEEEFYFQREQMTQLRKLKLHQVFCSMHENKCQKKGVRLHGI